MKRRDESGFTLIDTVCALAMVAMIACLALPMPPRATSRARLESYALATASLLKGDRNLAMRRGVEATTDLDEAARTISSRASGRLVQLPPDVTLSAILATQCNGRAAGATISFFPSGMSCGGAISLARRGSAFEVRVAWLMGGVEVVPVNF